MSHNNHLLEATCQPLGTNILQRQQLEEGEPGNTSHHGQSHWEPLSLSLVRTHSTHGRANWQQQFSEASKDPDKLLIYPQIPQRAEEIQSSRGCKNGAWQALNFVETKREPAAKLYCLTEHLMLCSEAREQLLSWYSGERHFAQPMFPVIVLQQWLRAMKFSSTDACKWWYTIPCLQPSSLLVPVSWQLINNL